MAAPEAEVEARTGRAAEEPRQEKRERDSAQPRTEEELLLSSRRLAVTQTRGAAAQRGKEDAEHRAPTNGHHTQPAESAFRRLLGPACPLSAAAIHTALVP